MRQEAEVSGIFTEDGNGPRRPHSVVGLARFELVKSNFRSSECHSNLNPAEHDYKALNFKAPREPYSRAKVQSFREKGANESDVGVAPARRRSPPS